MEVLGVLLSTSVSGLFGFKTVILNKQTRFRFRLQGSVLCLLQGYRYLRIGYWRFVGVSRDSRHKVNVLLL